MSVAHVCNAPELHLETGYISGVYLKGDKGLQPETLADGW